MNEKLLKIKNLRVSFMYNGGPLEVVRGVDIEAGKGEIVGLLGESGSGKTVSATAILGTARDEGAEIQSGEIYFKGRELLKLEEKEMRKIRGKEIAYVFQNPVDSLNPFRKIGKQIEEVLKIHGVRYSREQVVQGMRDVGIDNPEVIYNMYPNQLSGGQAQRVLIAMSVICRPELLIADEPTSAIDASLRKKVLEVLKDINSRYGTTVVIITHDFDVVKYLCHRLIIMYGGLVMEEGSMKDILDSPLHPYTLELLKCVNSLNKGESHLYTLDGRAPTPLEFDERCPFYARCKVKTTACSSSLPELVENEDNRRVRCFNPNKNTGR